MKALKIELSCGKDRWIFSAFSTLILVTLLLIFPFRKRLADTKSSLSSLEKGVSVVTVIKKKALPLQKELPQKIEKKIVRPEDNVIPEKKKEPVLEEKIEERAEESSEEDDAAESEEASSKNIAQEASLSDSEKKALASYKSYALARIASKKIYPYAARSKGLEGKVRARIVINADGNLVKAELLEKSPYDILNEACLSAIEKAVPFKKMPSGQKSLTLTFAMDFSIKDKA